MGLPRGGGGREAEGSRVGEDGRDEDVAVVAAVGKLCAVAALEDGDDVGDAADEGPREVFVVVGVEADAVLFV